MKAWEAQELLQSSERIVKPVFEAYCSSDSEFSERWRWKILRYDGEIICTSGPDGYANESDARLGYYSDLSYIVMAVSIGLSDLISHHM